VNAVEIHHYLYWVCRQNVVNGGIFNTVVECGKMNEKKMFTMKNEVLGWPSIVSDNLVKSIEQNICEKQRFTISELV
jgi:hypothetical protein